MNFFTDTSLKIKVKRPLSNLRQFSSSDPSLQSVSPSQYQCSAMQLPSVQRNSLSEHLRISGVEEHASRYRRKCESARALQTSLRVCLCVCTHRTARRCCLRNHCRRRSARGCGYSIRSGSGTRPPRILWELHREERKIK